MKRRLTIGRVFDENWAKWREEKKTLSFLFAALITDGNTSANSLNRKILLKLKLLNVHVYYCMLMIMLITLIIMWRFKIMF